MVIVDRVDAENGRIVPPCRESASRRALEAVEVCLRAFNICASSRQPLSHRLLTRRLCSSSPLSHKQVEKYPPRRRTATFAWRRSSDPVSHPSGPLLLPQIPGKTFVFRHRSPFIQFFSAWPLAPPSSTSPNRLLAKHRSGRSDIASGRHMPSVTPLARRSCVHRAQRSPELTRRDVARWIKGRPALR